MDEKDQEELDEANHREAWKKILNDAEEVGSEVAAEGRKFTEEGQRASDLARKTKAVLDAYPNDRPFPNIEDGIEDWSKYRRESRKMRDQLDAISFTGTVTSASTAAVFSSDSFEGIRFLTETPSNEYSPLVFAIEDYHRYVGTQADQQRLFSKMSEFRLDVSMPGRRSALDQIRTAFDAMRRTVQDSGTIDTPANTSLIPMREGIETALDHLLELRPNRTNINRALGPNQPWRKVVAVAEQLKKVEIDEAQVSAWARDWVNLKNKDLSPAKNDVPGRDEWIRRINRATVYFEGLLDGLDPMKIVRD